MIRLRLAVAKLPASQREAVAKLIADHSVIVENLIAEYDQKVMAFKTKLLTDITEAISAIDDKDNFIDSYFAFWDIVGL